MWNASLGYELAQLLLGVLLTYYFFKLHCVISLYLFGAGGVYNRRFATSRTESTADTV